MSRAAVVCSGHSLRGDEAMGEGGKVGEGSEGSERGEGCGLLFKALASLPCVCCGRYGVAVHPAREGLGMRRFLAIPLCPECLEGANGFYGDGSYLRIRRLEELDLVARMIERISVGE